jgi:hypothetical protein
LFETASEYNAEICMVFTVFQSAYDVIRRGTLYDIMIFFSPNKVIRLTQATFKHSTYHVKIGPVTNDGFKVGNGLKKRNWLAFGLFITALECVANTTSGITVK